MSSPAEVRDEEAPRQRLREDVIRDLALQYGVPVNPVSFADSGEEAARVAQQLGGPVALKIVASDVVHKSKAGGVVLNVPPSDVASVTEDLLSKHRARGSSPSGVTVEAMVDAGLEVVIGAMHDASFGPIVMFGRGGVDVETVGDFAFRLAPIDALQAAQLIEETRVGRVVRNRLGDSFELLVQALLAVGGPEGMLLSGGVDQIDLNPMVVTPGRVTAVDARAVEAATKPMVIPDITVVSERLSRALYPRSVAVVGASAEPSKMGYRAVRTLLDFGFEGEVYPVSRTSSTICGLDASPSISDLPASVDRAVIALPAPAVSEALIGLDERGVGAAHVYTAGTPPLPVDALAGGLRVLGPNCIGHYSPYVNMTMISADASSKEQGHIAFVSQSGTYAGDVVRRGKELGLRFSFVSSVGNCDDVRPSEFLAFCEADENTRVAAFYLEDDRDAGVFFRLAQQSSIPIVLFKGGQTSAGVAAAASHTGALAGDPRLLRDAAAQSGVLLVNSLDELLDVLLLLQFFPAVSGDGLGLVGSGGGVAVVGTDKASEWGLRLNRLGQSALEELSPFAAPGTSLANPVDIPIWSLFGPTGSYTGSVIQAVAGDMGIDSICAYLDLGTVFDLLPADEGAELVRRLTLDIVRQPIGKPLVVVLRTSFSRQQEDLVRELQGAAAVAGVPMLDSVDRAVTALGRVRWLTSRNAWT